MKEHDMKSKNFSGSDDFVVAIRSGAENFEIKDGMKEIYQRSRHRRAELRLEM